MFSRLTRNRFFDIFDGFKFSYGHKNLQIVKDFCKSQVNRNREIANE